MGCGSSVPSSDEMSIAQPVSVRAVKRVEPSIAFGGNLNGNGNGNGVDGNRGQHRQTQDGGEHTDKASLSPVVVTDKTTIGMRRQQQLDMNSNHHAKGAISTQVLFPAVPQSEGIGMRIPAGRVHPSDADPELSQSTSYFDTHSTLQLHQMTAPGTLPGAAYTPPLSRGSSAIDINAASKGSRPQLKVHPSRPQHLGPPLIVAYPSHNIDIHDVSPASGDKDVRMSPLTPLRSRDVISPKDHAALGLASASMAGVPSQLFGDERSQVLRAEHEVIINRRHGHATATHGSISEMATTPFPAPISPLAVKAVTYAQPNTVQQQLRTTGFGVDPVIHAYRNASDGVNASAAGAKSSQQLGFRHHYSSGAGVGGTGGDGSSDPVSLTMHTHTHMHTSHYPEETQGGRLSPSMSASLLPHQVDRGVGGGLGGGEHTVIGSTLGSVGGMGGDRDRDLSHTYTYHALISHTRAGVDAEEERERAEQRDRAEEERERKLRIIAAQKQRVAGGTMHGAGIDSLGSTQTRQMLGEAGDALYDRSQVKNLSAYGYAYHATRMAAHRAGGGQHSVLHSYAYAADGAGGPLDATDALYSRMGAESPDPLMDMEMHQDEPSMMAGGDASRVGGMGGIGGAVRFGGTEFESSRIGSRMQQSSPLPASPAPHARQLLSQQLQQPQGNGSPNHVVGTIDTTPPRASMGDSSASAISSGSKTDVAATHKLQVPIRRDSSSVSTG
jgi:hypothetical protein